jgi:RNA polymerase sigma-70 factor (ECF subfamily)
MTDACTHAPIIPETTIRGPAADWKLGPKARTWSPLASGRTCRGQGMSDHPAAQIEAHIPGLRRFARQLVRGDPERADDLVQDTLERALSHWHLRRNDGDMHGWLYTILYHRFLTDLHREKRRNAHHRSTDVAVDRPEVEGQQEAALIHRDLLRAFAELPEEQRSVLFLVTVEDLSYGEAARVLGVPIGTVMSRLSRGREKLRRYLSGERQPAKAQLGKVK